MEIKNDTIFQIKTKVLLYRNKKYFKIFRKVIKLIGKYSNFFIYNKII